MLIPALEAHIARGVGARPAVQIVATRSTDQDIIIVTPEQIIGATATGQRVIAKTTGQNVGTAVAGQRIALARPDNVLNAVIGIASSFASVAT